MKSALKSYDVLGMGLLFLLSLLFAGCEDLSSFFSSTEPVAITGVSMTPVECELEIGETQQISVHFTPEDASDKTVKWESTAPSIATVNGSGLVTAVNAGSAEINMTTNDGGFTSTTYVTVNETTVPVTGITLSPDSKSLVVGDSFDLSASISPSDATNSTVTWSSSAPLVATVNDTGTVSALAAGTADITVTTEDGSFSDTCALTVTAATVDVTGVQLDRESAVLAKEETLQLNATITPGNATNTNLSWVSSEESVATVGSSGLVTAVSDGTATITVTTDDGNYTDSAKITVPAETTATSKDITFNFDFDENNPTSYNNIYVIWMENPSGDLQHLYVCNRLLAQSADKTITDRDSALPFWHVNYYDRYCDEESDDYDADVLASVDAVTGATEANSDFTITATIDESLGDEFTIYFELDESFEYNDAFPGQKYSMYDQPAVLFSQTINLADDTLEYTLEPQGFTPMYDSYSNMVLTQEDQDAIDSGTLTFAKGTLFERIKYITHGLTIDGEGYTIFDSLELATSALRAVVHSLCDSDDDGVDDAIDPESWGITATISDTP